MPPAPGESPEDYEKRKVATAKKKEKKEAKAKYKHNVDPSTVLDVQDPQALAEDYFENGQWGPAWEPVEFDGDACLANVSKTGKAASGFFVPAGSMLPLGAVIPAKTVLKYGGYFPAGTSFHGGVLVPMHARMVNILPQQTFDPATFPDEGLCIVQ